uniref:Protein phosphatase 1, regulatory (inhibitor) subunit 14Aa n=1 Tax=Astatotilapia calliptera TaxID=8154 RepID=A0AAX7UD94_ASTCA
MAAEMAAEWTDAALEENAGEECSRSIPKRHARVTVKYNRKELQRRLDVEKWIDESLDRLYAGQESDMPEEVNIDDLLDLPNEEERVKKLQELLQKCRSSTEGLSGLLLQHFGLTEGFSTFIKELVVKLQGVHRKDELQSEGIEHPVICHGHYRHEPYHFNNPQHHHHFHHNQEQNQTL